MISNRHAVADNKYIRAMDSAKEHEILEEKAREFGQRLKKGGECVRFHIASKEYKLERRGDTNFLYEIERAGALLRKSLDVEKRPLWERSAEHEEREGDNYILYLDANNLYGKAMSMKLPTGGYRWGGEDMLDLEKLKAFDRLHSVDYKKEFDEMLQREYAEYCDNLNGNWLLR